jgi:hypothetical protein
LARLASASAFWRSKRDFFVGAPSLVDKSGKLSVILTEKLATSVVGALSRLVVRLKVEEASVDYDLRAGIEQNAKGWPENPPRHRSRVARFEGPNIHFQCRCQVVDTLQDWKSSKKSILSPVIRVAQISVLRSAHLFRLRTQNY